MYSYGVFGRRGPPEDALPQFAVLTLEALDQIRVRSHGASCEKIDPPLEWETLSPVDWHLLPGHLATTTSAKNKIYKLTNHGNESNHNSILQWFPTKTIHYSELALEPQSLPLAALVCYRFEYNQTRSQLSKHHLHATLLLDDAGLVFDRMGGGELAFPDSQPTLVFFNHINAARKHQGWGLT